MEETTPTEEKRPFADSRSEIGRRLEELDGQLGAGEITADQAHEAATRLNKLYDLTVMEKPKGKGLGHAAKDKEEVVAKGE
jgi:hypothetical protein